MPVLSQSPAPAIGPSDVTFCFEVIWLGREGAFRKKVVDPAGLNTASRFWMWAVGLEPSQSLPSGGSVRRAECAGLTPRRR